MTPNCWLEERNALTAVLRAPAFRLSVAYKTGPMDTPKVAVPRNTATKHTEQSAHQAAIWVAYR